MILIVVETVKPLLHVLGKDTFKFKNLNSQFSNFLLSFAVLEQISMQPKTFIVKDGRKVVLRSLRWEDLEGLMEYINSLIDEKADIYRKEKE